MGLSALMVGQPLALVIILAFLFLVTVLFSTILVFILLFGSGSVFLTMLVVKTTLLICFLCVGFSRNWLKGSEL